MSALFHLPCEWTWIGDDWDLTDDGCSPAGKCDGPPQRPGAFSGDIVFLGCRIDD